MKNKLRFTIILLSILPTLILGCFFIPFGMNSVKSCSEAEITSTLNGVCAHLCDEFSRAYPGDYHEKDGQYYSGDINIKEAQELLETYKDQFNAEVTIFFDDTRVLTTIEDESGSKIVGTVQDDDRVIKSVFSGNSFSSDNVMINNKPYYVTYYPLYDGEEVAGMVFAGMSDKNFRSIIQKFYVEIIGVTAIIVLAVLVVVFLYANEMGKMLLQIKGYLGNLVDSRSLEVEMAEEVVARSDEIGDLARYAVTIGEQLKNIMGRDPLTGLFNRRSGRHMLDKLNDECIQADSEFCLVMCDIDHFKDINDGYGHAVGDKVLKKISEIILGIVDRYPGSFAIRWGGEEVLIGFPLPLDETLRIIEGLRKGIGKTYFAEENYKFYVTVTFGISSSLDSDNMHDIIKQADDLLYIGKNAGRDVVVTKNNRVEMEARS